MWPKLALLGVLAFTVRGAVVIQSGVVSSEGHQQEKNGGLYDGIVKTGSSNFEGAEGFKNDGEKKVVQAQDGGNYNEGVSDKKHHVQESGYAGEKFHKKGGDSVSDFGAKTGHKKGHHRTGFRNTYHKDESGSNTSFYDDAEDAGDQVVRHTEKGAYGDVDQQHNRGSHLDGSSYSKDEGKQGGYNNAGSYHHDAGNQNNYNQQNHHADNTVHGKSNIGNQYNEAAYHNVEKHRSRPPVLVRARPHHHPEEDHYLPQLPPPPLPAAPLPARKTITIYEDPRIGGYARYNRYDEPAYADDYIQLDVKRSPLPPPKPYYRDYRSYDRYPAYDDYYYY